VIGPRAAGTVEVTTFRYDVQYSDGRHPDSVEFTSAQEDARRRDFTINGLFYDPLDPDPELGVIDFVGGVADLHHRVVRAIGDPRARFGEDKLRLLRAVRMAATFDFALEAGTQAAIAEFASLVTSVSAERIAEELRRMLVHPSRARAVELLRETGLLAAILPEMAAARQSAEPERAAAEDPWRRVLLMLSKLSQPSFSLALAVLLEGLPLPDKHAGKLVDASCRRLRLSNNEREHAIWLVEHRFALAEASSLPWPRLQRLLISDEIEELLELHEADAHARGASTRDLDRCRELLKLPAAELNPPPLISGDDLLQHGVRAGRIFKLLLDRIRDAQLNRQISTRQEALDLTDRLLAEGFGDEE
jgi:poly(A) polymerase